MSTRARLLIGLNANHLFQEILGFYLLSEPDTIIALEELATIGKHFLTVNPNDEWRPMSGSNLDGCLFVW